MFKKVCLLSCHNQYEAKRYFTLKLSEAFNRKGIDTLILSWDTGAMPEKIVDVLKKETYDFTCSFHALPTQSNEKYFWNSLEKPHLTMLLDPAFYDLELMQSAWSIISCVDRDDCALLQSYHFENVFFFPHAIERELLEEKHSDEEKDLDVVMLATCYDPENLRAHWKKTYPAKIVELLDETCELVLSDRKIPFWRALPQVLVQNEIELHDVPFDQLAYYVDEYTRGVDRLRLIRSIKNIPVHIFGGICWREEKPIADWVHYLSHQSNVTIHPPVNFNEALQIMKRSKICLNSMPFFKNGSHERIFAAFACGALPLTSENLYLKEQFEEDRELLFYHFQDMSDVENKIRHYLRDQTLRKDAIISAQAKIKLSHTWDSRVELLLIELPAILNKFYQHH
jgi:spore maturation protein CgeB